jgi:hypothetical protein
MNITWRDFEWSHKVWELRVSENENSNRVLRWL